MKPKKTGLGKGLGALFMDYDNEDYNINSNTQSNIEQSGYKEVDIGKVYANPDQPRKIFEPEALNELADSIRVHGIIQPLIVVEKDGKYMIIAGERRFRAASIVGLDTVPAIIKEYNDQKVQEISLIENLQREDLNPIEAAKAIKKLMQDHKYTQEAVSERLGKSRSAIANTLRLLNLPEKIMKFIESGDLSAGHARTLVVIDDEEAQIRIAQNAVNNKLSVRDIENAVKKYLNPPQPKASTESQSLELKELISLMQKVFATKITAIGNDNKGRIYIDYFTRDDLDRIFSHIECLKEQCNL